MQKPPDIPGSCERDIDLLLLEELCSNPDFGRWFIPRCSAAAADVQEAVDVKRSVTQSSGESDLEVTWRQSDGALVRLLIENKVDASLQPLQALGYRRRADDYVANGQCTRASTVLIAPSAYLGPEPHDLGFDTYMVYEDIRAWFEHSELGARGRYKAGILTAAINKATLGYNPIADDSVSRLSQAYWELSIREAPGLAMDRPGPKPAKSSWVYFTPGGLPPNLLLVHKLSRGFAELNLGGAGDRVGDLRKVLRPILDPDMAVERTGKSSSVRIAVPPLQVARDISQQQEAIAVGFEAARRLLSWARAHVDTLRPFLP